MLSLLLSGCAPTSYYKLPAAEPGLPASAGSAAEPAGFIQFCIRFADQCASRPGTPIHLVLDEWNWRLINQVNRSVNAEIWPEDDETHYGRSEYWTIPMDGYGDCDDYAVTKRKELIDAGLPLPALRLAVVYSPESSRHAVLTVATDRGDLVLDNLSNDILSWRATGYTWIERQAAFDSMRWVSLRPAKIIEYPPAQTANVARAQIVADGGAPTSGMAKPEQ